MTKIEVK
jgi:hypothetical protein